MTCHVGSSIVDPTICLSLVPGQDVISFKIAPLLGGAKRSSHDMVKAKVANKLEMHGVAKDSCVERAAKGRC